MAARAFLDGSWGARGGYLTLSGVFSEDLAWNDFDGQWIAILRGHGFDYLHMRKVVAMRGEERARMLAAIGECVQMISNLYKQSFKAFICILSLGAYQKVTSEGVKLPSQFDICNMGASESILNWHALKSPKGPIHYYFDQNEEFKGKFENRWIRQKKRSGRDLLNPWHLIKTISVADMKETPALQLTDLFAWSQNREFTMQDANQTGEWSQLAQVLRNVFPADRRDYGEAGLKLVNWADYLSGALS